MSHFHCITFPETNIFAPENGWLEDYKEVSFWGLGWPPILRAALVEEDGLQHRAMVLACALARGWRCRQDGSEEGEGEEEWDGMGRDGSN